MLKLSMENTGRLFEISSVLNKDDTKYLKGPRTLTQGKVENSVNEELH